MLSRSSGLAAAQSVQMIELSLIFVVAGKEEGGSWNLPSSMGEGGCYQNRTVRFKGDHASA